MTLVEQMNGILNPRSVAVIGASNNPEKMGYMCVQSMVESGFPGGVYPVNPNLTELFNLKVYPTLSAVPGEVDLAIITIPAQQTLPVIEECVAKGIKGAVMITSGFRELGTDVGMELQKQLRETANRGSMKIIGPNCLGMINPRARVNATFRPEYALTKIGGVSLAAQSGGMITAIILALDAQDIGISKAFSMGNRCNLDFDEIVAYLGEDEDTKVIALYIEGVDEPRRLLSVASEVTKRKPIIVLKGGRDQQLNPATLSHTGALAGKYEFYKAAFSQAGILVVESITELADVAGALALQPSAAGDRVAIFSIQAGPSIVMGDACHRLGLKLAQFAPATRQTLRRLGSPLVRLDNPVDIAGTGNDRAACREMMRVVLEDDGVDAISVITVADSPLNDAIADVAHHRKPITVCLFTPLGSAPLDKFAGIQVPAYPTPEQAVNGLAGLVRYGAIRRSKG
ncbi:MAG: CoA-binding protein [Chloroflexi bacterium]|nr:CoA-binding protein [Chloroflexota bacterium]